MKVLFVSSGNSKNIISPIIKAQGESLIEAGVELDYFSIIGKGYFGYFKSVVLLKKHLRNHHYDIVHAHYSFSGFCATMAGAKNLVVSLMGSDVHQSVLFANIIRLFSNHIWKSTIVKSLEMRDKLDLKEVHVIPNGVCFDNFMPIEKETAQGKVNFYPEFKYIIFVSNPARPEKNFNLALSAVEKLNNSSVKLHAVYDVPHQEIVNYMYAADVLILTSMWEGSPNVIKEAMACNCPIVSVGVGDVENVIKNVEGCYISTFEPSDIADKLQKAFEFGKRTEGRKRIVELGLDSETVAKRVLEIYNSI